MKSLDVLRGLAILMVFLNHLHAPVVPYLPKLVGASGWLIWRFRLLGWTGVDLFFVLSGFLIGGLLFAEADRQGSLRLGRFWLRRSFKIWPSYFVILLVLGVTGGTGYISWVSDRSAVASILTHVCFLQNYLAPLVNGPTWSLAVEEHFYIVLPLVLWLLCRHRRGDDWARPIPWLVGGVVLLCLAFRWVWVLLHGGFGHALSPHVATQVYMESHFRCDSLFIGVFCRYLVARHPGCLRRMAQARWFFLTLVLVCVLPTCWLSRSNPRLAVFGYPVIAVGYAILLLLFYGGLLGRWEAFLPVTVVAVIGTWSYNIYLWHYFMADINLFWFCDVCGLVAHHISFVPLRFVVLALVFVGYAIGVGALATWLIERPFLKLRARFFPSRVQLVGQPQGGVSARPEKVVTA